MFIVIDGIDGAGKGTQVKNLEKILTEKGKKVKILDYPRYGQKSCFFVEKYLNGGYGQDLSPKISSLFYALDRFDEKFEIGDDFEKYDFVISNRYTSSSAIHQAGKILTEKEKIIFLNWLEDLEYNILGIKKPDKIFFLDISIETSKKLLEKKEQREYIKNGNKDIHEKDENHIFNAHKNASFVADLYSWEKIKCEKNGEILSIDEITNLILEKINF